MVGPAAGVVCQGRLALASAPHRVLRALRKYCGPGYGVEPLGGALHEAWGERARDRKSTRLNSSHLVISYAVFCLKKKKKNMPTRSVQSCYATHVAVCSCV